MMKLRLISQQEVPALLPMDECIEVMSQALRSLALGEALMPLRQVLWLPGGDRALGVMPSYLSSASVMGVKVISVFPGNLGTEFDSHQGAVLLFETRNGSLLSIIDASAITAIRTAAVSGLATRLLSRDDAMELAILGSGVQARTHLESMRAVREIQKVRVWSPNERHLNEFCVEQARKYSIDIKAVQSAQDAVEGADIVCAVTSSRVPVLELSWLKRGAHINAVGSFGIQSREIDSQTVAKARLFVDRRESAANEAGEYLIPKSEGLIGEKHIVGELGDLLLQNVEGRTSPDDITLFKSLGLAIEDLAAAHHIYNRALETGTGTTVEFGGSR